MLAIRQMMAKASPSPTYPLTSHLVSNNAAVSVATAPLGHEHFPEEDHGERFNCRTNVDLTAMLECRQGGEPGVFSGECDAFSSRLQLGWKGVTSPCKISGSVLDLDPESDGSWSHDGSRQVRIVHVATL